MLQERQIAGDENMFRRAEEEMAADTEAGRRTRWRGGEGREQINAATPQRRRESRLNKRPRASSGAGATEVCTIRRPLPAFMWSLWWWCHCRPPPGCVANASLSHRHDILIATNTCDHQGATVAVHSQTEKNKSFFSYFLFHRWMFTFIKVAFWGNRG